ncbi:hypothetical protein KI387_000531, partial [Taxus chinensis]
LQQDDWYRLGKLSNICGRQANTMGSRVLVNFTHKPMECNYVVQRGKPREHKKHLKNVISCPMNEVLGIGNEPEKVIRPSLDFKTLLQFYESTLGTISSVLVCRMLSSEILNSMQLVSSGIRILVGYWVGPDFEDGWGYVEASVVRVRHQ